MYLQNSDVSYLRTFEINESAIVNWKSLFFLILYVWNYNFPTSSVFNYLGSKFLGQQSNWFIKIKTYFKYRLQKLKEHCLSTEDQKKEHLHFE